MSLLTSDTVSERATFPAAGPFASKAQETKAGNETMRAILTSMLALYPVLAAVAVAVISLTLMGPNA